MQPLWRTVAQTVKNLPTVQETQVWSLGWEDPLEKMTGRLQSMGSQRIRHDWACTCVHCSTTHNSQHMEATWMSIYRWMDKKDVTYSHIHNGILLSHTKQWNNTTDSNMDGPGDYHSKWNLSQRKVIIIWYHLYVEPKIWNKRTYLQNRNRLIGIENKPMITKGESRWVRGKLGVWD